MRELRELETAAPTAPVRQSAWGLRQGLSCYLGIVASACSEAGRRLLFFAGGHARDRNETRMLPQGQTDFVDAN